MPDLHETINQFLEGSIASIGRDPVIESKNITENGTYMAPEGVDGYSPVVVNVPSDEPVIESKNITENGTYMAPEGVDGYSPVVVNVPSDEPVIESKTITENGTYTPESGVDGFAPVVVNVPLPQNAYLLKSVTTPTPIASFNDGQEMVMQSLKVAIEPQQEGSGEPSPTNIRPISGWDEVNVTVADDVENPTVSNVYTIDLDGTRYGGEVDVSTGELVVTHKLLTMSDITWLYSNSLGLFYTTLSDYKKTSTTAKPNAQCELFNVVGRNKVLTDRENGLTFGNVGEYDNRILVRESSFTDLSTFESAISGKKLVYELATPLTIQLTPTAVKSLLGQNNVWADTGDIMDAEYFSKEV